MAGEKALAAVLVGTVGVLAAGAWWLSRGPVTLLQLRAVMPKLSLDKAVLYLPHLNAAAREGGITTPLRLAAWLAQMALESGELRWWKEFASGAAYEGRKDLGNTQPGDGVRFPGRGPFQITGRANNAAAGKALGLDLINEPELLEEPEHGFRAAAWFWNSRGLSSHADQGTEAAFKEITRRINGGYTHLAERQAYYATARKVLGV